MSSAASVQPELQVFHGQFGDYTITEGDRRGVLVYRASLAIAALCFAIGSFLILWVGNEAIVLTALTPLYFGFLGALAVSLLTIHIYLAPLHRALQAFWFIGTAASVWIAVQHPEPLALTVYDHRLTIFGIGFAFAALTGIFFKEAFCFNRLETKLLTPVVPMLLLGHLAGILPLYWEQFFLATWAGLFVLYAFRKFGQPIPGDIGDKSVFDYLKQQKERSTPQPL